MRAMRVVVLGSTGLLGRTIVADLKRLDLGRRLNIKKGQ